MSRTILHVDMDAFYTSVEQRDEPSYRGKPVIVGADPQGGRGRGVVAAASYEAREFGVRSAMPISRAYRQCPHGVYLRGDMKKYAEVSRSIMALFKSYTDLVEPISIDEAFLDVSLICRPEKGEALAVEIKQNVWNEVRLKASVGAAPNKFLAKIASDLDKPDGLVTVRAGEELEFLGPLPIERLWGVGPKTAERLHAMGFHEIRSLWDLPPDKLKALGKHGEHLLKLARGIDAREVVPHHEPKSIGHETTFLEDIDDPQRVRETLLRLADAVARRLRKHGFRGRTLTLKFRDEHFVTETRSRTLGEPIDDAREIFRATLGELDRVAIGKRKIRLLGISLSKLVATDDAPSQLSLFETRSKKDDLNRVRDRLDARFGSGTVERASLLPGGGDDGHAPEE